MRTGWNKVISGLAAVALVAAVGAFAWNVMGMSVDVGLAQRVSSARDAWAAKNGGSYRAVVRMIDYNRPAIDTITVVVKDGKPIEASARPATLAAGDGEIPLPASEVGSYSIEALFDYALAQVGELPYVYLTAGNGYRYSLSINPELSYIEEFKMDICGRGPLADSLSECRWGFDVLDVRLGE